MLSWPPDAGYSGHVRRLGALTIASLLCAGGCTRLNPGFNARASESGTTGDGTGSTSSDSGSTGDGSTGDMTGGSTTGMVPECIFEGLGRLRADVLIGGVSQADCGQPFESWGLLTAESGTTRDFRACTDQTCTSCSNDMFSLELSGGTGSVPDFVPDCTRVRVEREYLDPSSQECRFSGVVLSAEGSGTVVIPIFIGSSKVIEPPGGLTLLSQNLAVTPKPIDQCDCPDCCNATAQQYEMEFTLGDLVELLQPADFTTTLVTDIEYKITNLQSHDALVCGAPPAFDWTVLDTSFLN